MTLLLISLDNTILNVALPSIVRSLRATSTQLQWIVDAYAIVFAGLLLTLGALGDRVGRKRVFMGGWSSSVSVRRGGLVRNSRTASSLPEPSWGWGLPPSCPAPCRS